MNDKKKTTYFNCTACGGGLDFGENQETVKCPYCGTVHNVSELLNDSDSVKIEKIKSKAYKDVESEKLRHEIEKDKLQEEKNEVESFKKGKFSKVLLVFAGISLFLCVLGFTNGRAIAGIIAIVMALLFFASWFMGMRFIKEPRKGVRMVSAILGMVLVIPYFAIAVAPKPKEVEKIEWKYMILGEYLPKPPKDKGNILCNSENKLNIDLYDSSKNDFYDYVDKCKGVGFTVDAKISDDDYSAFNQDGYKLDIDYLDGLKELSISLVVPEEMGEFEWTTIGVGKLLPVPKSNVGYVITDSADTYSVCVGNTSKEDYNEYVKACEEAGFTVDYIKNETYFSASNADGCDLSINYTDMNTMDIYIYSLDDEFLIEETTAIEETTKKQETTPQEKTVPPTEAPKQESEVKNNSNQVSADFKATMDSYEAFFDEYVDFMKKYSESDDVTTLFADYTEYMTKYADYIQKLESVDEDSLSDADLAYYLEVQNRINKKLLEVAY